ncbi:MAG: hypothetical protein ISS13_01230 [Actinobacteria bacterium]|nr:hypothetical protein [Actinomycetota bacterium]
MIFKELINTVNYNHMWAVLDKEYNNKDGAYEAYKNVLEELKTLKPGLCKPPIALIVAKIEDYIEPGTYIFDVFGIIKGDKNHYALEMTSWDEWLNFNVLDKCIEVYGNVDVTAHSLYEMTFFGYSKKTVDERVKEEKRILDKGVREIENGTSQLISFKEAMKKINFVDNRTSGEKEYREYNRIASMNEKIYKMLLGR